MTETIKITSRDNPRLKYAKRVRDGKEKDSMFVEGARLAEDAFRSRIAVGECFVSTKGLRNERVMAITAAVNASGITVHEISVELFRSISDTETAQGILLICDKPNQTRDSFERSINFSSENIPVVVFLEEGNNPSNLGAILRTAEAAGTAGVIVSKNSADPFSPKSLRASMGSAFRIPVWTEVSLGDAAEWAREHRMIVTAADVESDKSYTQINWKLPRLMVFGSEAHGLREVDKEKVQDLIKIPMDPNVESLNLAVSAGVILFEAKRQIVP